ncbi:transposase, partial [Coleofasciculus sp. E1-EBD-02]
KKRVLWTGSYFVSSCGGVTIERLKVYIQEQECPDSSHRAQARVFSGREG